MSKKKPEPCGDVHGCLLHPSDAVQLLPGSTVGRVISLTQNGVMVNVDLLNADGSYGGNCLVPCVEVRLLNVTDPRPNFSALPCRGVMHTAQCRNCGCGYEISPTDKLPDCCPYCYEVGPVLPAEAAVSPCAPAAPTKPVQLSLF